MKKPDRFERMVDKLLRDGDYVCCPSGVVSLLRAEHAWMRRMVKKVDAWAQHETADFDVILAILLELDRRRK